MFNKRLIKSVDGSMEYILKTVLFQWLCLLLNIFVIFLFCRFFKSAYYGTLTGSQFLLTAVFCIIAVLVRSYFSSRAVVCSSKASQNAKAQLRAKIFSHLSKLGPSYSSLVSTAEAVQVSVEGIDQLETYFGQYVPQLFYALLAPVTLFAFTVFISVKTALLLLVCVPLIPLSIVAVQKLAKRLLAKYWNAYTNLGDNFLENIQGLTTLKIYEADLQKHKEMNENAELFRKATMRVLVMQLNSISVMDIVAYAGAAAGIIAAAVSVKNNRIDLFQALFIVLLSAEFFIPMRMLGSFFHIAMNGSAAADKLFKILDMPLPQNGNKAADGYDISFNNVSFSYPNGDSPVIKNIHLNICTNSITALVGKSGCGKSTIASVISGKYKNYNGSIKIGSVELNEISESNLMKTITVVSDNSYIFKGTVKENLLMGNSSATDNEMKTALGKVNLLDFINSENGLDTLILENGANLSGGQKQRLSIARALLKDSPVYIFDEATSSIDPESEEIIMSLINSLAETKTVILISHRLSNVVSAKRIYFLENGIVTEEGSHSELMTLKGNYSRLFENQQYLEKYSENVSENNNIKEVI